MQTEPTTRHDAATLSLREICEIARQTGAGVSFPHLRDVLIWGDLGAVKKTLAVMGLGLDREKTGRVQRVYDAAGRAWGQLSFPEDGTPGPIKVSARLDYLLSPA